MALKSNSNNYRQNLLSAVTFFILTFLICPVALSVLPPKYYKEAIHSSTIKAIAVVKKVEVLDETNRSTFKKVFFKLEKSLTSGFFQKKVPQEFSGLCYSVDHSWQDPGVGGTIHFYPRKGVLVLVTVGSDGGGITSYTTLSPAFEEELRKNGLKNIKFGMGHAYIKKSALSPASKREQRVEAFASSGRWYYYTAKNYQKAFQEFKKAARLGHAYSQNYLGNLYFNGLGVEQDFQKALEWYEKSAGLGNPDAGKRLRNLEQNKIDMKMEKSTTSLETKKLFNALYENNISLVMRMLDRREVDINVRNETGQTLLHIALDKESIKLLISKGADVNARDAQGMTPIFNKEINLIILLVKAGADIGLQSSKGNTALMWFAYSGYLDGIRYLVSRGADIEIKNKDNQTAFDIAEKFGHLKVVEYLKSARFEIWLKSGGKSKWP